MGPMRPEHEDVTVKLVQVDVPVAPGQKLSEAVSSAERTDVIDRSGAQLGLTD